MDFIARYLAEAGRVAAAIDQGAVARLVECLVAARDGGGRLFILGVGGSAGNASHAVNDFRKIAHFEAYAPTDNVSELTARINDDGWDTSFAAWLQGSRLSSRDMVLVFSVGGGDADRGVSTNLVRALELALGADVGRSALDLAGPESLPHRELVLRVAKLLGTRPRILPLPLAAAMALAFCFERLAAEPPLTRAMLGVLEHDDCIDPAPAAARLGLALTPLDATLRFTFDAEAA